MSTKIYTAIALPGLGTKAALSLLASAQEPIQALVDKKNRAVLVERIVEYADGYVLARHLHRTLHPGLADRTGRMPWFACMDKLKSEQQTCRGGVQREPLIDCDVELSLFMLPKSGRVLGIVHEERVGALDCLRGIPGIVEFDYWNNTDRPDDMTARAWSQRARTWKKAFDDAGVTRFSMRWQPKLALASDIKAEMPSLQERARRCAVNFVQSEQLEKHWPQAKRDSFAGAMQVLRKVEVALADPASELSQEVDRHTARFIPLLVENLAEHLLTPLGEYPGLPPMPVIACDEDSPS